MKTGKQSAGILLYRRRSGAAEVLLVHPGGPFWRNKDAGAWTIPKGEFSAAESPESAARREFLEETGFELPDKGLALKPVRQKAGKWILAWAVEKDLDTAHMKSNDFGIEWPPRSGRQQRFPEVDRYQWFPFPDARIKINPAQTALIDELESLLNSQA